MGRRSATETITALLLAFAREATWSQAERARVLGVTVGSLRRRLDELTEAGVPLERSEDHPHVYWSVPPGWLPGAVSFSAEQAESLMRLLARHARTPDRDSLLAHIVQCLPRSSSAAASRTRRASRLQAQEIVPARAGIEPLLPSVEAITQRRWAAGAQAAGTASPVNGVRRALLPLRSKGIMTKFESSRRMAVRFGRA